MIKRIWNYCVGIYSQRTTPTPRSSFRYYPFLIYYYGGSWLSFPGLFAYKSARDIEYGNIDLSPRGVSIHRITK
jgi:hypothetical protein